MIVEEFVILVDQNDHEIGEMEKQEAHLQNKKHRAFSVFLLDENNNLILQQRAASKYHSPGLWTNACCGHPRPNETTIQAAKRRTLEEMGINVDIHEIFQLSYEEQLENGLWENEFDHIFIGKYTEKNFNPNPEEIQNLKHISIKDLQIDLIKNPEEYTFWFKLIFPKIVDYNVDIRHKTIDARQ